MNMNFIYLLYIKFYKIMFYINVIYVCIKIFFKVKFKNWIVYEKCVYNCKSVKFF